MTQAPASFASLADYTNVDVAGYSWMVVRRRDGAIELSPVGEQRLANVLIVQKRGDDGAATYLASVGAPGIPDLAGRRDGFASAEDAIAWAAGFEFASRQAGSLTWRASSAEDRRWYTVIGTSVAEIYWHDPKYGGTYIVKRRLQLGHQWVEFQIGDGAYGEEAKSIVSFEQASAIALTMPDYVMELMRVPADATQPAGPAA
ncbi:hypothetical protein KDX27_31485 [Burkholderia cenocepacia]|uniref:hypothetical protein n=1 Tax=Burkholderia cenocepacia TaxID=95486 RepID=UPI001BA0C668|nr:hypothetical protein [Burkholderia cenocepacia]MBR8028564.1 hypothetical protein [Burkholderia cenocepacia]MBR8172262.1 hypothetical protein [Burkholderia cenocepacia]